MLDHRANLNRVAQEETDLWTAEDLIFNCL